MAIKSGRVGVAPDQVDAYGRVVASDTLVDQLKDVLPQTELIPLLVLRNGDYSPPEGKGYGEVSVIVPTGYSVNDIALGAPTGSIAITIPRESEVARSAFRGCLGITSASVMLSSTINSYAFANCNNLASFTGPNVQVIGDYGFYQCHALSTLSLPLVYSLGSYCFAECDLLIGVDLSSVQTAGSYCFYDSGVILVTLDNMTTLGHHSFNKCSSLASISAAHLVTIDDSTFYGCSSLSSINFPSATTIKGAAFRDCTSLQNAIFPKVTSVHGAQDFNNCPANLVFPSLTAIGSQNALSTWKGEKLDFGTGFVTLGYMTFNGMNSNSFPFNTLIIRNSTSVPTLANASNLAAAGAFRSGGSGGTIYIPEVLYNHLGDGTSLDYLSSTNWAAVLSTNANNTFAKIEGSYYETHYADGSLISEVTL